MTLKIGRIGFIGLGIEATPGTPVASTTTLPYINNTFGGKHNAIEDISARADRRMNFTSVIGKRWSEGEIDVNVDTLSAGFLFKLAMGNEALSTVVASQVFDHLFYTTTSGNTPLTATLYVNKGIDTEQYPSVTVDKLDIDIKDDLMTAKTALKGMFPTSGSHTLATVSGTLIPFGKFSMQLGNTIPLAVASSAVPVTNFTLSINNNAEVIFESGSSNATRVFWKQAQITGSFTRYFEAVTDRDNYYNLNKQSLVLTASGIALPGSNVESLTFNFAKLAYQDTAIETGLDDFFAVKTTFTAEVDLLQGKQFDIVLRNYRSSVYS